MRAEVYTTSPSIWGFVPWPRRGPDAGLVAPIRAAAAQLAELPTPKLHETCARLRERIGRESVDSTAVQIEAFALMCAALRHARGIDLYDVQLQGAMALAHGTIAEMQTGEGKTYSCAPAALLHALTGKGVHVATTNAYLAERDYELLLPAYRLLGVSVGLVAENADAAARRTACRCDITYGTGYGFGFDYLRDQLALRRAASQALGSPLLAALAGRDTAAGPSIQRGLYFAIVDEADHVLLDDAASPLVLSEAAQGEAADAAVHSAAREMLGELTPGEHFRTIGGGVPELTPAGVVWIHRDAEQIPIHLLRRTWTEYVEQAMRAALLRRDVHYVVDRQGRVQIVDAGTGRIFTDRTWRDGLHQAVEAKERLQITPDQESLAQITRQRFFRLYERLAGMTGTGAECRCEFRQVYRLEVEEIPLRTSSQRRLWPARYFATGQAKWSAIAASVAEVHAQARPVLVGTHSILDSEHLAALFQDRGIPFQLLNGRQDAAEATIVAQAGRVGVVTIATSLAGRGTDIRLEAGARELGGLHVVVCERHESARVDRQLIGRCARQGDPGSAQAFVSADDALVQRHGPWLADSMRKVAGPSGELNADLSGQIGRLQQAAEQAASANRKALLRQDLSRDSLLGS